MRKLVHTKYTIDELKKAVKESYTLYEVICKLGLRNGGSVYKHLHNLISEFNIDISHFNLSKSDRKTKYLFVTKELLISEYLVKGRILNGDWLRKKLFLFNFKKDICEECGIITWKEKPLTKRVHHVNEDHSDNRLENLQILCSNCHTQKHQKSEEDNALKLDTGVKICVKCKESFVNFNEYSYNVCNECLNKYDKLNNKKEIKIKKCNYCAKEYRTFRYEQKYCSILCSKKDKGIKIEIYWPPKEELEKLVWERPTYKIAKDLGISDSAVGKHCKKVGIEKPPRGYWNKKRAEHKQYPKNKTNGIQWPTKEELEKLVWEKSLTKISEDLKVSVGSVRYRCRRYNIETPPAGYWSRGKRVEWPPKEQIEKIVTEHSINDAVVILNCSITSLIRKCKKLNIELK